MRDWFDGFLTAFSLMALGVAIAVLTGYLKVYGIGMFGVGRLFCFQGP